MATQLVPYNTAMQLGAGFNSYTQSLCVDHAVVRDSDPLAEVQEVGSKESETPQAVVYKTSVIEKTTDVTDEMSISGAFNIKFDQLTVNGGGSFINTNKIKDSDVSIMVSVKVINQRIYDHSLTKFQPISNVKDASPQRLVEVYGDSYISGWQEGGEFLAIISIKAKNRDEAQTIAADAKIAYTRAKNPASPTPQKDLELSLDAKFNKIKKSLAGENETSISVTWTGGGQNLKKPESDWDFDTMKDVALRFPDLCAKTPMRTHALLTKYTALRSFYTAQTYELPTYDQTGTYTNILQEAYLDYKAILSAIQVLAFDVSEGTKALVVNPRAAKAVEQIKAMEAEQKLNQATDKPSLSNGAELGDDSIVNVSKSDVKPNGSKSFKFPVLIFEEAFEATIVGLEEARLKCRYMMNRIIQEIDNITVKPAIATDESRPTPYLSPFLFKLLMPVGVALAAEASQVGQAVAAAQVDPDALAGKFGGVGG